MTSSYRIVPVEATREQLDAARDWSIRVNGRGVGNDQAQGCYAAMLSHAPELDEELRTLFAKTINEAYWRAWCANRLQPFVLSEHEADWTEWLDEASAILALFKGEEQGSSRASSDRTGPIPSEQERRDPMEGER